MQTISALQISVNDKSLKTTGQLGKVQASTAKYLHDDVEQPEVIAMLDNAWRGAEVSVQERNFTGCNWVVQKLVGKLTFGFSTKAV